MFGDIALITIWVSLNSAIMMLVMFMYHLNRLGRDENRQDRTAYDNRADRKS